MRAGERLVANDGKEVCLFPLEYMYISQGENGQTSHQGTYNIDYLGWNDYGRVYHCSIYAPVTCTCVYAENSLDSANIRVFQSVDRVHLADGTIDYCCFAFSHDNTPTAQVGAIYRQGTEIARTGDYGRYVTGDHTHVSMARGTWAGFDNTGQHQELNNRMHQYDGFYINETVMVEDYGYNWRYWGEPVHYFRGKFPWFIYNRKRRLGWK